MIHVEGEITKKKYFMTYSRYNLKNQPPLSKLSQSPLKLIDLRIFVHLACASHRKCLNSE